MTKVITYFVLKLWLYHDDENLPKYDFWHKLTWIIIDNNDIIEEEEEEELAEDQLKAAGEQHKNHTTTNLSSVFQW